MKTLAIAEIGKRIQEIEGTSHGAVIYTKSGREYQGLVLKLSSESVVISSNKKLVNFQIGDEAPSSSVLIIGLDQIEAVETPVFE